MSECNHDCASCASNGNCGKQTREDFLKPQNDLSDVKHVIAVMSGKGGVGKSMVTSLIATSLMKKGYKVGILDADITGPSIPKAFGVNEKPRGTETALFPVKSKKGISIMSSNLLLDDVTDPIIWRGPVIAGAVEQFWTDVAWGDIDYLIVDMPPGTGDVPLTTFQSLPVEGIVIVTSPQDLVSMIVEKAVKMANKIDIKVLSIIENMSYFECPNCGEKHYIFGKSNIDELAYSYGINSVDKLKIDPTLASLTDEGLIEEYDDYNLNQTIKEIEKL